MKNFVFGLLFSMYAMSSASASTLWLGNIREVDSRRGGFGTYPYNGQPYSMNICSYDRYDIYFDYYQIGVTDVAGTPVWQKVSAQVNLVQDSTQKIIASKSIAVVGMSGNNAVYKIMMNSAGDMNQNIAPSAVSFPLDPNSKNTHLVIYMNGQAVESIPVQFFCSYTG